MSLGVGTGGGKLLRIVRMVHLHATLEDSLSMEATRNEDYFLFPQIIIFPKEQAGGR